jgi:hypothetical protein
MSDLSIINELETVRDHLNGVIAKLVESTPSTSISKNAAELFTYMQQHIESDGFVKIEKHTGWAHSVEKLAQH